jgi:hypothetical protein
MSMLRPRLTMAGPLLRGGGELHIIGRYEVMTINDPDGAVHRLLELADGSHTRAQILAAVTHDFPHVGERDIDEAVLELEAMGLLQDAAPRGRILSSRLVQRDRHELLAEPARALL